MMVNDGSQSLIMANNGYINASVTKHENVINVNKHMVAVNSQG